MSSLNHILNEIRDLSPADLQELSSYLQVALVRSSGVEQPVAGATDDFDADLDAVTVAAPALASSFSRADIYDDHD